MHQMEELFPANNAILTMETVCHEDTKVLNHKSDFYHIKQIWQDKAR